MFDIGFAELLIVAVVALVVLGPEKLPTAARTLGLWLGRIRRTVSSIQSEITEELRIEEMKRTAAIEKEQLERELQEMRTPFEQALDSESPMSTGGSTAQQGEAAEMQGRPVANNSVEQPSSAHASKADSTRNE
ncbi:Sec-independent protein translocase protein TatB [Marinobacterium arenosum]|uniref:Sec-independent protein translocase protein TatB n=1 Tax=Marinobacterium arenosum TaxID=2862496 RepID=UPI001C9841C9|nr:Sec-independent protein translocase protein TatB [Marinobacterium arenosum]MBY4678676.1 Sec-independent protein translocase protein TatB [Marinobacterium arenosum]